MALRSVAPRSVERARLVHPTTRQNTITREKTLQENKNYLAGLNVYKGLITHKGVAKSFKMQYFPPEKALTS